MYNMVQPTPSMICEEGGVWPVKRHTHPKSRIRPEAVSNSNPPVPLKVWVLATASCLAVCATLVLATVAIAKWDSITGNNAQYRDSMQYSSGARENSVETDLKTFRDMLKATKHSEKPEPIIAQREGMEFDSYEAVTIKNITKAIDSEEMNIEPTPAFVGKLKSMIGNIKRGMNGVNSVKTMEKQLEESFPTETYERNSNLGNKPQFHPEYDSSLLHQNRNIEKKDKPKIPGTPDMAIPDFKPTLPDNIFFDKLNEKDMRIKLPDGYIAGLEKYDENYYNNDYFHQDDDIYEDYIESNTMTSYLLEKIQELYDWITGDPDFDSVHKNITSDGKKLIRFKSGVNSEFGQLLKALNESIVDGNVTIVLLKLRELYYGKDDNITMGSIIDKGTTTNKRFILTNGTDLLSFGMLSLDIMLLHNIQLMAWDNQESTRLQMLKDPEVFAFNALFMDPNKIESTYQEVKMASQDITKNSISRHSVDDEESHQKHDKSFLEDILDFGLSTARAAIHLGKAYKNAKATLQRHASLAHRESVKSNKQQMAALGNIARTTDHRYALSHLRDSYTKDETEDASLSENVTNILRGNLKQANHTELDCIWYLYCRNLAVTSQLQPPYGTMARINGLALRMISGELPLEKALDSLLMEALTGWSDLQCSKMFPKCNNGASKSVLDSIVQPQRRSHHSKSAKPKIDLNTF